MVLWPRASPLKSNTAVPESPRKALAPNILPLLRKVQHGPERPGSHAGCTHAQPSHPPSTQSLTKIGLRGWFQSIYNFYPALLSQGCQEKGRCVQAGHEGRNAKRKRAGSGAGSPQFKTLAGLYFANQNGGSLALTQTFQTHHFRLKSLSVGRSTVSPVSRTQKSSQGRLAMTQPW